MAAGGRPKIEEKEKRKLRSIRATDWEWKRLKAKAKNADTSVSRLLLAGAFNYKIRPKADKELLRNLQKIGVNLNQIAKVYNATGEPKKEEELREVISLLFKEMKDIG